MKRIPRSVLASLLLLSACGGDTTKTPAAAPAKPAANPPAAPAAKPAAPAVEKPAEPPVAKPTEPPVAKPAEPPVEKPAEPAAAKPDAPPAESPTPPAKVDMDAAIKELMAKPEQPVDNIEIQHVLIGFKGAPRMTVTRSKDEAKALAEKVYAEAIGGADFDALVKQYTNDSPPGIYPLDQTSRRRMVKSFGDVGWRLKVGEIGVAPWDAAASPFGWHIIKRLK